MEKKSIKLDGKEIAVKYVEVKLLNTATYNPRKWDAQQEEQLKESIERFGFIDPIIVNCAPKRKDIVIGGHFRLAVAKKVGIASVPVVFVNIPDEEKEKELNLRLNRNTGDWNFELLKEFDLNMLLDAGFNDQDLSDIWDDHLETEDDDFDLKKELEEIKNPKVKLGDMYQMGNHRLICGDSTDPNVVKKLMGKVAADMIYCDPVYNIALDYNKGVGTNGKYGGANKDKMSYDDYKDFLKKTIANALAVAKKDCHVFYWCDQNYVGLVQELYRGLGLDLRRVCLWVKNNQNVTPQIAFNKAYEPCVYATKGKPYISPRITNLNEILNKETGTGNRLSDDIMDIFDIWLADRLPATDYEHPTQKPVTLHDKPLRRCTKIGDAVLDLFGGSGSTMIACELMKRTCFLAELDPVFCEVIVNRYERLTGNKAILIK